MAFAISAALGLATWSTADPGQLWAFVLVGMLVPGASQIVFIMAVRDPGPSRAAILIGTAPLMSVLIALTLLGEPFHAALVAGTVLIVAGGAALTRERIRPHDFKALGAGLALLCAALFAVRDNLVRWVARDQHPPPLAAAAASLLGATILLMLYAAVRGRNPMGRLRSGRGAVRAGRSRARGWLRVPARSALARARQRRRPAQRNAVALGGRVRSDRAPRDRGDRAAARRHERADRRRRRVDRDRALGVGPEQVGSGDRGLVAEG